MLSFINKYFKSIHFSQPISSDIVIFHKTNSSLVESVVPNNFSVSIFRVHPIEIYITPKILYNFFINLRYFSYRNDSISSKSWFSNLLYQLLCIYIKADLMSRNPRAIITSIDNCSKFAWLSENFQEVPCIAIQNGFRLSYEAERIEKYYCQHLFCFGEREIKDFPSLNYKVDNFYPVGSLNLALSLDDQLPDVKPLYDLLVVSCWRGNIGYAQDVEDSMRAMRIMDQKLAGYLDKRNLKSAIILRSERESDQWFMPQIGMTEEDYYRSIYGDLIEIIDANFLERNIYPVMNAANAIIAGFGTTCLIEAFAMGKKVLYVNCTGTTKYHVDFKPEIVAHVSEEDSKSFNQRINALIEEPSDRYFMKHKELMEFYIESPKESSTEQVIKNTIVSIIEDSTHDSEKYC